MSAEPEPAGAGEIRIRELRLAECGEVADILNDYAREEILLWRSSEDIRKHLDLFRVAVAGDRIVGCVALHPFGGGLTELRSLAVRREWQSRRIGGMLVRDCLETAARRGRTRVFALTCRVSFFLRLGFRETEKEVFPEKVWVDCRHCPRRDQCNETAVVYEWGAAAE